MANPTPPADPPSSPPASELRRRLLASAPPPSADTAAPEPRPAEADPAPEAAPDTSGVTPAPVSPGSPLELLSRLRMPGKSGAVAVTAVPPPAVPVVPTEPTPTRPPVNRRTPPPSSRLDSGSAIAGALNQLAGYAEYGRLSSHDDAPHPEIQRLKGENKELRNLLLEMKHLLQEASDSEQRFAAREKEFEETLAAKDVQIQELSAQLGAIEEQIAKGELVPPPPVPKTRGELEEWSDELEQESARLQQERKRLDEERRQLHEDEEALERQMREMEVSMARERALLARQETELRRLNAEIQHELELMQRGDANLREQMAKFQRRAQEVLTKPPGGAGGRR